MSINFDKELKKEIQQQLKGWPQAILYLTSGRNIEIDLEKEGTSRKDYYYFVTLFCNGQTEYAKFAKSNGVINKWRTEGNHIAQVMELVTKVLRIYNETVAY